MATQFHFPVTAAEIGEKFAAQYYTLLQQEPEYVYQHYSDASTMIRVDGDSRVIASTMKEIHDHIITLNYSGIVIKMANSLESWNGGVLVMVSGSVHLKDFNARRNFVQTFFLAPQETGYFVLNDIFQFTEEDQILQLPVAYFAPNNPDSKLIASTVMQEQAHGYMLGGDFRAIEFEVPANFEENGPVDSYSFPEQQLPQVSETAHMHEDSFAVQSNGAMKLVQEYPTTPLEEPVSEPQKHTYASIVAKGKSTPAVPSQLSSKNTISLASERNNVQAASSQASFSSSVTVERSGYDTVDDFSAVGEEVEIKSVYVKNVPSSASASAIAKEFRKFGKVKHHGVAIRSRKDDLCYAFVEYEDIAGTRNAIKASTAQICGQQVYIEKRTADRIKRFRGGRGRGRGKGGYHMDVSRGSSGRNFTRSSSQEGEYNRSRGNGHCQSAGERVAASSRKSSWNGSSRSD